ncbi:FMN-dependent NADH-azoreductase (plasmid) [Pseudoseohaeicola sp. NH-UV-7]|uniref:FMN-dependent NADH-azoreductase n=1 Tax=Sulfitobacter sp. TBRI5 TaxID=2989732 RepID=UPI003A609092
MTQTILHIDASARTENSISRDLTAQIVSRFPDARILRRDLAQPLPLISADWIGANFTPAKDRDDVQRDTLALSDTLVGELVAADVIVIGAPIYNFAIPAALKAWIDLIARAGLTFEYSADGPKGLLQGKRAIIAVASGGTKMGSDIDFATGYLRHVLGFVGITQVEFVAADQMALSPDATLKAAQASVRAIAA